MTEQSTHSEPTAATNFEKFLAVVCWWFPLFALFVPLFEESAPASVRRHAVWALLSALAVAALLFTGAFLGGLPEATSGVGLLGGFAQAITGLNEVGQDDLENLYYLLALVNTIAVLADRNPYFTAGTRLGGSTRVVFGAAALLWGFLAFLAWALSIVADPAGETAADDAQATAVFLGLLAAAAGALAFARGTRAVFGGIFLLPVGAAMVLAGVLALLVPGLSGGAGIVLAVLGFVVAAIGILILFFTGRSRGGTG